MRADSTELPGLRRRFVTSAKSFGRVVAVVMPPDRMLISQWAERKAYIPKEGNAEHGKYRLRRLPWQRAMLDDPLNPNATVIVWVMASQVAGKTLCIILIAEYHIEHRPIAMYAVYPTIDSAKKWFRKKFITATRATPCMKGLLKEPRERDSESTTLDRNFPGGNITGVGANSPSALRQESKEGIIEDELDAWKMTDEGDPEELADLRATTFANAWIIKSSTPTNVGTSRIWNRFDGNEKLKIQSSDKQYYFVPCPWCGHFQHLQWAQFKFSFSPEEYQRAVQLLPNYPVISETKTSKTGEVEIRDTKRTVYVCAGCQGWWTDQQRIAAIQSGHEDYPAIVVKGVEHRSNWRATAPFSGVIGRHLNGFYKLMGKKKSFVNYHHEFAENFLHAAAGGREKVRVWTNTTEAKPYEDKFEQAEWHPLMQRAENYGPQLPVEVMLLIAGADIHPDRVEIGVIGWGDQEESWAITKEVIWGNFDLPECQERVNDFLLRKWQHPVLGAMGITAVAMDLGHQTKLKSVYRFCRQHRARKVWGVKGSPVPNAPIYTATQERRFGIWRYNIGTDTAKTTIFDRLAIEEPGPRYIHFPKHQVDYTDPATGQPAKHITGFTEKFYRQLCSEKREKIFDRGIFKQRWVQTQERNEDLDIFVYVLAAFEILNPIGHIARQWQAVLKKLETPNPKPQTPNSDAAAGPNKEYQLNPDKTMPAKPAPTAPTAPKQRPQRRPRTGGGMFNPLGL